MSDRILCEFYIIRYVPDVVRGEFVNIGVILRQLREDGSTSADDVIVRFTRDWARVRCLDPGSDIQLLNALEAEFRSLLEAGANATNFLEGLKDTLSNSVQVSEPRVSLAQTPAVELEQLMRMYVEM